MEQWYCAEVLPSLVRLAPGSTVSSYEKWQRSLLSRPQRHAWGVQEHLWSRGFRTFNPTCLERRFLVRYRRHDTVERPLFPGYMFVEFDPYYHIWQRMLTARGMLGLVKGPGSEMPARVDPLAMKRLIALAGDGPVRDEKWMEAFPAASLVKITKGAWQGWTGNVDRTAQERVWVLLQMFGVMRPVEFSADALEMAG